MDRSIQNKEIQNREKKHYSLFKFEMMTVEGYDKFSLTISVLVALIHIYILIEFWRMGYPVLSLMNIISALAYVASGYYGIRGKFRAFFNIVCVEVLFFSGIMTICFGKLGRFDLYCIALISFSFLTGYVQHMRRNVFKLFRCVIIICAVFFLELYVQAFHHPLIMLEDITSMENMERVNVIICLVCTLIGGFSLYHAALDNTYKLQDSSKEMEKLMLEAQAANETKSDFLAKMSHEIRTPMNAICGMSDLLLEEQLSDSAKEYVSIIKTSSDGLLDIINDILDFSRIEAGKLPIVESEYNPGILFRDVASMIKVRMKDKDLILEKKFDENIPVGLLGDDGRIRQVLINLLGNSVKYTIQGKICFNAGWESTGDNQGVLDIEISDTGIGIKKEDIERLFLPFEQADLQKNKGVVGTGLGLAICRGLVDKMKGQIYVESEYGKGTTFHVRIPQKVTNPETCGSDTKRFNAQAFISDVKAPTAKIMIVDDNKINLVVANKIIQKFGINSVMVESGKACIEKLKEDYEYDIIFMDHMMPEMDGIETTKEIRRIWQGYRHLPIVALTANAISGMDKVFLEAGMDDYLSKPIDVNKLNELLIKWLPEERWEK